MAHMGISVYLKEVGRGAKGARALSREQACDLMGQLLDGHCSDLETGAFCIAMRFKGETPVEMAGFLDAIHARITRPTTHSHHPVVVLPSYNGARKQPVLTPLLAMLLARKGLPVLIHGTPTEDGRVCTREVLAAIGITAQPASSSLSTGTVHFVPTESLLPGLQKLLDVRRTLGLRNTAHSLVKLMNPVHGPALVVGCYTHPAYTTSMRDTFQLTGTHALLLRGTEGEPVADARRTPAMDTLINGQLCHIQQPQPGSLTSLPALPTSINPLATAEYTLRVLHGLIPPPQPVMLQVEHIARACKAIMATDDSSCLTHLHA